MPGLQYTRGAFGNLKDPENATTPSHQRLYPADSASFISELASSSSHDGRGAGWRTRRAIWRSAAHASSCMGAAFSNLNDEARPSDSRHAEDRARRRRVARCDLPKPSATSPSSTQRARAPYSTPEPNSSLPTLPPYFPGSGRHPRAQSDVPRSRRRTRSLPPPTNGAKTRLIRLRDSLGERAQRVAFNSTPSPSATSTTRKLPGLDSEADETAAYPPPAAVKSPSTARSHGDWLAVFARSIDWRQTRNRVVFDFPLTATIAHST
ncbi:hypothetical protein EV714DRAFT_270255 [Schizophyllum commune]